MRLKLIRIIYFANLTIAGLILGLTLVLPIYPGLILTGIGAILFAIICGREIIKENKKKVNS